MVFSNERFLLFMYNLGYFITMASIVYMTLIIFLQKREKKDDIYSF